MKDVDNALSSGRRAPAPVPARTVWASPISEPSLLSPNRRRSTGLDRLDNLVLFVITAAAVLCMLYR